MDWFSGLVGASFALNIFFVVAFIIAARSRSGK